MFPAASVSGIYLAHPESRYCDVGRIDRVQVEDYARRRGMGLTEMEHWLAPNLAYQRQYRPGKYFGLAGGNFG
jgi:5-methyltetrahydrofolate--homocysteine methyltransferase